MKQLRRPYYRLRQCRPPLFPLRKHSVDRTSQSLQFIPASSNYFSAGYGPTLRILIPDSSPPAHTRQCNKNFKVYHSYKSSMYDIYHPRTFSSMMPTHNFIFGKGVFTSHTHAIADLSVMLPLVSSIVTCRFAAIGSSSQNSPADRT